MHRVVLHIYGQEGIRLCISEKINRYLSINVSPSDPLPKTICNNCLERLENQHRPLHKFDNLTKRFRTMNWPVRSPDLNPH
ncbi:unnamed protein product, partial [Iphiclides podalirius]